MHLPLDLDLRKIYLWGCLIFFNYTYPRNYQLAVDRRNVNKISRLLNSVLLVVVISFLVLPRIHSVSEIRIKVICEKDSKFTRSQIPHYVLLVFSVVKKNVNKGMKYQIQFFFVLVIFFLWTGWTHYGIKR